MLREQTQRNRTERPRDYKEEKATPTRKYFTILVFGLGTSVLGFLLFTPTFKLGISAAPPTLPTVSTVLVGWVSEANSSIEL
jgi:hypothetical protein